MINETPASSFPATKQDLANLKQTATDAVKDLSRTASVHAAKAKDQIQDLTGHVRQEGGDQLAVAQVKWGNMVTSARNYAAARPLACIGVALTIGLLFGLTRRSSCQS